MTDFKKLMQGLDKYREKPPRYVLTDEQKEFLLKCRDNEKPVPYDTMAKLWKQLGWGDIGVTSIVTRYKKLKGSG